MNNGLQMHCKKCGRTMSRRDKAAFGGIHCYYCHNGLPRPPAGDLPFHEVERRLQQMVDNELLMPWERPAKRR